MLSLSCQENEFKNEFSRQLQSKRRLNCNLTEEMFLSACLTCQMPTTTYQKYDCSNVGNNRVARTHNMSLLQYLSPGGQRKPTVANVSTISYNTVG